MKAKTLRHFIYLVILVATDQITKYLAVIYLKGQNQVELIPGVLHLQYLENDGAVFGILGGKVVPLAIVTFFIIGLLIYFYFKIPDTKRYNIMKLLFVIIIAGAIGNLIDRIRFKYVIDFIYFSLIDFPIFNVADIYVTLAVAIFIFIGIFYYKDEDFEFLDISASKD